MVISALRRCVNPPRYIRIYYVLFLFSETQTERLSGAESAMRIGDENNVHWAVSITSVTVHPVSEPTMASEAEIKEQMEGVNWLPLESNPDVSAIGSRSASAIFVRPSRRVPSPTVRVFLDWLLPGPHRVRPKDRAP